MLSLPFTTAPFSLLSAMAPSLHCLPVFFALIILVAADQQPPTTLLTKDSVSSRPNALVLLVSKNEATNLHVVDIQKRTPLKPVPLVLDVNGRSLWVDCESNYLSSTYNAPQCHSTQCSRANLHDCRTCSAQTRPGCHNNTCGLNAVNPVSGETAFGELAQDVLSIPSTDGSSLGQLVTILSSSSLVRLPLWHKRGSHLLYKKFALCLTSPLNHGVLFLGEAPYRLHPGIDVSHPLGSTPLSISREGEYFIQVTSIRINERVVPVNPALLNRRPGSTLISTTTPYTVLEHSIYQTFTQFYANQMSWAPRVQPIAPFGLCFDATKMTATQIGPEVANIDLVLHNRNNVWRIVGANSMVQPRPGVWCLGFVDGGSNPKAPIILGSYQLEDNLLQFDLARSRLGFSSSLLFRGTHCGNFFVGSAQTSAAKEEKHV
ncbi:Basic 7S globulin [Vitis vinifera]|uniref:Basic 7S globulin n=1 Tax=Vitis vinifera TaxID=29760 RepID=A0A438F0X3_VITVI|nr:Basic 7S globulin [Vitis vinifera]